MPEETGSVVIKAPDEILERLQNQETSLDAIRQMAKAAEFTEQELDETHNAMNRVSCKAGYLKFDFECVNWKRLSQLFIEKGKGIEWYALISDEYGAVEFYSLNEAGERFHYSFDLDGDLYDEDWYQDEIRTNIEKWKSALPDELKTVFPDFVDTEDLLY